MVHQDVEQKSDALVRAWRTFGQGLVVTVLWAVGDVLTHLGESPDWGTALRTLGVAAGTAVVTYVHNLVSPKR